MGSGTKRLQYTYDVRGNRRSLTDADGGRFTYGYDSRSRITNVRNPQGDRTTFSYNAVSQRTVTRLSNGTRTSFSYDAAGNLTLLSNRKSDGSLISSFQYGYDKTGNRTSVLEGGGSRVTWSYDAGSQLAGEHRTGTTPYRNTFTYDAAGNRTLKNEGGARTTYSYDTANQLQWSQAAAGRTTYTFDADGNQQRVLAPDGSRTTTAWDYENRSTRVQLPSGIRNTMAYEPEGLRVKLEESAGTKKFVWDEQNYLAETDGANDTQVVYTNEPQFYGRLLSQRRGSTPSWYHYDGLGSTRELTDATQAVTDQKLYDAWGSVIQSSGSTVFPFQYVGNVGYYTDADQDTIYIRARTYQPSIARWWSIDPANTGVELSLPLDFYPYGERSPATLTDNNGRRPQIPKNIGRSPLPQIFVDCRMFDRWYERELQRGTGWTKDLPECPCSIKATQRCYWVVEQKFCTVYKLVCEYIYESPDSSKWDLDPKPNRWGSFHPDASACIRSLEPHPGQQCCYDKSGKLITWGPSAGSADLVTPGPSVIIDRFIPVGGHVSQDVRPFEWALSCDGGKPGECVEKYFNVRPADKKNNCPKNP